MIAMRALALAAVLSASACVTEPATDPPATSARSKDVVVDGRVVAERAATAPSDEAAALGAKLIADGEYASALLVLRIAEDKDPSARNELRIEEARALHLQSMHGSALALLATVVDEAENDAVRRRALGLAGTIHAATGDLVRAEQELRRSLDADDSREDSRKDSWEGATRALSDLGVVLLREGKRDEGVNTLLLARRRFLAENDAEGAAAVERNLMRASVKAPYPPPMPSWP